MSNTTNNYTPYTAPVSGVSFFIRPISPALFREINNALPEPEAPREQIIRADGLIVEDYNRANPDYLAAVNERNARINGMMSDVAIELASMITLSDEQKSEIADYRVAYARISGNELTGSLESQYLKYIALVSIDDINDHLRAVMNRIKPDEKKSMSGRSITEQPIAASLSGADPQEEADSVTATS
jgi:hypothetical protein